MFKNSFQVVLLLILLQSNLSAASDHVIRYEASYMGISLLNMTLIWEDLDSTIQITYNNELKPFVAFFHPLHNIYKVRFLKDTYKPLAWSKEVSEGAMNFFLGATRSPDGRQADYSNGAVRAFPEHGFTVFSATHFLASKAQNATFFPRNLEVMIDGEIWSAIASRYTSSQPHPEIKLSGSQILIQTDLRYVGGTRVMAENDILMDVIAREGTRFLLWVESDGSYSKAQFGDFPKAVVLERIHN